MPARAPRTRDARAHELTAPSPRRSPWQRKRRRDAIDKKVLERLAQQGVSVCKHCTMPILDPTDEDFVEKRQLILDLTQEGASVEACACGPGKRVILPAEGGGVEAAGPSGQ